LADIPTFYTRASSGSPLSIAVAALALGFIILDPQHIHHKPFAISRYSEALMLVEEIVQDPEILDSAESTNALVAAILLLDLFEVSRD